MEAITDSTCDLFRGWKTQSKKKNKPLINKVSASDFYFSVKTTENLITSLHSFVCLECHLLFSVTRFAKISLFTYQHLLSAGLDCLSLKPTSLVCFFSSFPSILFSPLSCLPVHPFKMFSWNISQFLQKKVFPRATVEFISQRGRNPDNPEQSAGKSLTLSTDVSVSYFQVL